MKRALFPLALLALSSAALADDHPWDQWAVIVDGHLYTGPALEHPDKPRVREVWMSDHAWCTKVAAEVGGKCVKPPKRAHHYRLS